MIEPFAFDFKNAEYLIDTQHMDGFSGLKYVFRKHPKAELVTIHFMREKLGVQGHFNQVTTVQDFYNY
jgi:hypothetical protein